MKPVLRAIVIAAALLPIGNLAWALALRFLYPYDLEWMEGGMLCHALRLLDGKSLYGPPSLDFIPFLYTPLYPALLALLSHVVPLGYLLGRGISLLAFATTLFYAYRFARREGAPHAFALFAIAIPCAAFVPTGAWYDLARPDSLFLCLVMIALYYGWYQRESNRVVFAVGALLVAAFFTKQTATPFMLALGAALLVSRPRAVVPYLLALAMLGLPTLYLLNRASDGWFWTYVFRLHQAHEFYGTRAYIGTPGRLALLIGPGFVLIPLALFVDRSSGFLYTVWLALVGIAISGIGFGTQWAFTNAFIPGILFSSIAIAIAASKLSKKESIAIVVVLVFTLALAPGGLQRRLSGDLPHEWSVVADEPMGYDLRRYVPTDADRAQGDILIARLSQTPGDVLIPFHPFYAHLAKKRTFLHRMGVLDIDRAKLGEAHGLREAIAAQRFSMVVMDDRIIGTWHTWPGLQTGYRTVDQVHGPRTFSGSITHPQYVMVPWTP